MKDCKCRIGHHKHFFINLAFHVVTLATALVTLHEIDRLRHKVKKIERR